MDPLEISIDTRNVTLTPEQQARLAEKLAALQAEPITLEVSYETPVYPVVIGAHEPPSLI
jgi:hypothetical protein